MSTAASLDDVPAFVPGVLELADLSKLTVETARALFDPRIVFWQSLVPYALKMEPKRWFSGVNPDASILGRLRLDKIISIGLRSGLYGGRNISRTPADLIASATPETLRLARLSQTTTSPFPRVGTRCVVAYVGKLSSFIAASSSRGALIPPTCSTPTTVELFRCPCGTSSRQRRELSAQPYSVAVFVLSPVLSMNTSLETSQPPCSSFHFSRFSATSGRSCSAAISDF